MLTTNLIYIPPQSLGKPILRWDKGTWIKVGYLYPALNPRLGLGRWKYYG